MRPIDGDALLEKFNRKADIWTALTDEDTASDFAFYCKLADAVEEMPTIGGWISVKDRMPEKQTPVLVYVPSYSDENEEYIGHIAMACYTYSARGGYWAGTDGNVYGAIGIIHDPTHWMPLPSVEGLDET